VASLILNLIFLFTGNRWGILIRMEAYYGVYSIYVYIHRERCKCVCVYVCVYLCMCLAGLHDMYVFLRLIHIEHTSTYV